MATEPAAVVETKSAATPASGSSTPPAVVNPPAEPPPPRTASEATSSTASKPPASELPKADPVAAPKLLPDEASLRQAVTAYEAAMSSGSRAAVKAVFPGVSESELRDIDALKLNFGRHQYRMTVIIRKHDIDGTRARVDALVNHTGIDDRGKQLPPMSRNERLNFEWTGRTWVRVR
jgi:hypothetical protein